MKGRLGAIVIAFGVVAFACGDGDDGASGPSTLAGLPGEWPTFAANVERTGYASSETGITKENVANLVPKWHFKTDRPVAASAAVATVDVPDEGDMRLMFVGTYGGAMFAVRVDDGTELWRFDVKPHAGISYGLIVSSATVALVDGEQRVFVGGGETMYALDAATGDQVWAFDAGTGCMDCEDERNEILSSPAVLPGEEDLVLFGMDVNDNDPGKGGFYAVSARDGTLRWYFDLETEATCYPDDDDDIRKFDGFHSAEELELPGDFLESREGCDFDRSETSCGSVWSPVSIDMTRKMAYFSSSNCDTDTDPETAEIEPPMPKYDEAIVAIGFDGKPAWTWRPREVDNDDLAFGAAPNLFTATIEGVEREVVGIGGKDGTYYLLDRDGTNEITNEIEPYWQRNVVPGGSIGGITGTPAVVDGVIVFSTAFGTSVNEAQSPFAYALDTPTGEVLWTAADEVEPSYAPVSAVPGIAFVGGATGNVSALDLQTGERLVRLQLGGLAFSQSVVVDGVLYVGSGFGTTENAGDDETAQQLAKSPAGVWAFCVEGVNGCVRMPDEE
jgi:polyvinyl alcohol dehydrogenase (cytochrome)